MPQTEPNFYVEQIIDTYQRRNLALIDSKLKPYFSETNRIHDEFKIDTKKSIGQLTVYFVT